MANTVPHAPKHLSQEAGDLWRAILKEYTFADSHDFKTLALCCECVDTITAAREAIGKDGAFITNRFEEIRPHPAHAVIRDQKTLYTKLIKALKLGDEPPKPDPKKWKRSY